MSISPGGGVGGSPVEPDWRPEPSSGRKWVTLFLLVSVLALIGATAYLIVQLNATRSSLEQANQKIQAHEAQIAKLEGSVTRSYRQAEEGISALKGEVSSTKGQIHQATKQVETEVLSKTQQMTERLSAEQKAAVAKVGGEVEQLRSATSSTESKLGSLTGEVSGVRSEVTSTKAELQKTIAQLKSVQGDLGVQSGLIATNSGELSALKRLGERNYFEFDLRKAKQAQRVGNISMKLKSVDPKRNRYTVEVVADDKLTEKKDKTINEPVQFLVAKSRIPYEIVVNQISKDRIVGYLATPKDQGR